MAEKADKKTHLIKGSGGDLGVDDDGRSVAEVKQYLQIMDPSRIEKAGNAYVDAGAVMYQIQRDLEEMNKEMATCWEGKASVEAQKALRVLHATVRELQNRLFDMGRPLENLGKNVLPRHKKFIENDGFTSWSNNSATYDDSSPGWYDVMDGGMEWGSQDELAGKHLAVLNKDLVETYQQLPAEVHKELPALSDPEPPTFKGPPTINGGGTGGLNSGDVPKFDPNAGTGLNGGANPAGLNGNGVNGNGINGNGNGVGGGNPGGTDPGANLPKPGTTPDVPNPDLPSTPDPGNTGAGTPSGVPDPNAQDPNKSTTLADYQPPRFDNPANPNLANPNLSNPNQHLPTTATGNPTTGVVPGMTTGTGGGGYGGTTPGTGLRAGAGGQGGMGMPFMPMGAGAGAGGEDQDRESSTWLREDDDVWGSPTDGIVNDTIA